MDSVSEIKSRLSIDQLVARYCQLQKKGRSFVSLCPFHNDSHPSLLVSPDKGIAYCFACQTGGDIFSFYQAIEGVDFRQALKDLAEMAGVELPRERAFLLADSKDEKDRLRACLNEALQFFCIQLASSSLAQEYLRKRGIPEEQWREFGLGYAPDSFSETYDHLLKRGFSRKEILGSGLAIQRELQEERIYDRFRHRLIFPIHDAQGNLIAFGGRTLGEDDAKYINSSEGVLYHKSQVLYGFHLAKEAIRQGRCVIVVEGYFDLLACHRARVRHVVATSGTAFTKQHAELLKRNADVVRLCLDRDRAGKDAAERAFILLARQGIMVEASILPAPFKDPDEAAARDLGLLEEALRAGRPYIDLVLEELRQIDLQSAPIRREALQRILTLLASLPLAVERDDALCRAATVFQTTEISLKEDLAAERARQAAPARATPTPVKPLPHEAFSAGEIALLFFLLYPSLRPLLPELIPPEEGMAASLHEALRKAPEGILLTPDMLDLPREERERVSVLLLYGEHHAFADLSESLALRELRKNCMVSNRLLLKKKLQSTTRKLVEAKEKGDREEQSLLETECEQVLKLVRRVR